MRRTTWLITLPLVILAASDSPSEPAACTDILVHGIRVEAVDARDGSPVTEGLTGTIISGSFFQALQASGNELVGAGERPGVYGVIVTATGFEPWTRSNVVVDQGVCHVEPVELTAELEAV